MWMFSRPTLRIKDYFLSRRIPRSKSGKITQKAGSAAIGDP
jgi:hypothetical protein